MLIHSWNQYLRVKHSDSQHSEKEDEQIISFAFKELKVVWYKYTHNYVVSFTAHSGMYASRSYSMGLQRKARRLEGGENFSKKTEHGMCLERYRIGPDREG